MLTQVVIQPGIALKAPATKRGIDSRDHRIRLRRGAWSRYSFRRQFALSRAAGFHQAAVLIVGHSYGFFDGWDTFRVGLSVTVVQAIILILLVPFYWPLIGLR